MKKTPPTHSDKENSLQYTEEDLLRENEVPFRMLAESSLTGIYLIQDGQFRYVNKAFADMFGYKIEEVLNQLNISDLIFPEDIPLVQENLRRRVEGSVNSIRYTFRGVRKDGSVNHLEVHGSRISYNGKPAVMGTLIDITEEKKAEESIKLSKFIIDNASIGIFLVDNEARILDVNRQGCNSLGYTKEELCSLSVLDIDPSFSREKWVNHVKNFQVGQSRCTESIHKRKNGETFPVEIMISTFSYNDRVYRVSFVQDITEKHQAKLQHQKLEKQLEQVQKLEAIGRLAGGIAHDLNNLLTPILGYSDLLYNDKSLHDEAIQMIEHITRAGIGARDLVKQLLAFSRKQVLEHKSLNVNTILDNFENLIRRTIREDVEIRIFKAGDLKPALLDKGQIEQVLMNLIVNASDAMPSGGKLTIETRMTELDESYVATHPDVEPGNYVMLAISDTGTGMDEETVSKIFEPFFSTKGEMGTGLGLATVYGIIKQHKGSIWVYSELGKGTTFKVYLPAAESGQVKDTPKNELDTGILGTEIILLVEDNEAVRKTVYDILNGQGYRVIAVKHGAEALEKISAGIKPDIVLTDVIMPRMNGKELYNRISEQLPAVKCLYMSGYTDNVIARHGVLDDGIQFIQKPFSSRAILRKVREVLESS
jgi:PAS domain S-box-containing protein